MVGARRLPPLALAIGVVAAWLAAAWNGLQVVVRLPGHALQENDFYIYWLTARIGREEGWNRIYSTALLLDRLRGSGRPVLPAGADRSPMFLNPPPLAWLVSPLTYISFPVALTIWTLLSLVAVVIAWRLVAPGRGLARAALLGAALGSFPFGIALYLGQVSVIVMAAVAVGWWLIVRGRPNLAGVVLAVIAIKPQVALLVPVALLVSGHVRPALISGVVMGLLGALSVLSLGSVGLAEYSRALQLVRSAGWGGEFSLGAMVGGGAAGVAVQVTAAVLALGTAWLGRHRGPGIPVAAGLVGGLLAAPYANSYEIVLLFPAAWLLLREPHPRWMGWALLVMYVPVAIPKEVGTWPTVIAAGLLLAMLAWVAWSQPVPPRSRPALPEHRHAEDVGEVIGPDRPAGVGGHG